MSDLVTLVVPAGIEGYPISHGTTEWKAYREDPRDPASRWLVDVPGEVARHLLRNGGFAMTQMETAPPAGEAVVHHPLDAEASLAPRGRPDGLGNWIVAAAEISELLGHGWHTGPRPAPVPPEPPVPDPREEEIGRLETEIRTLNDELAAAHAKIGEQEAAIEKLQNAVSEQDARITELLNELELAQKSKK